jgi:uncharacterized protein (DUF427 family)
MTTREPKIPGPDHPITIDPTDGQVVIRVGEDVIVEMVAALTLREAGLRSGSVHPARRRRRDVAHGLCDRTYCPYKGDASYYSITLADGELTDAVWSYREPYEFVADIAGHVASTPTGSKSPSRRAL